MGIKDPFCAVCGNKLKEGAFCTTCKVERKNAKNIRIKICRSCKRKYYKNSELITELEEFLGKNFPDGFNLKIIEFNCPKCEPKQFKFNVQLRGIPLEIEGFEEGIKDVINLKEGIDIRFSSVHLARTFVSAMKKKYKPIIKWTSTLVTVKEGNDVYRPTVLLRKKE